jgi:hypothetical protein
MVSTFPRYALFAAAAFVMVVMLLASHGDSSMLFVGP